MEAAAELGELRLHVPADIVVHVSPSHGDLQSHGALLRVLVHTLSHRPGEANDLDPPGARSPKLGCARRHRRPGRVDVIDEGNVARRLDAAHEGAPHVCGALAPGQPGLSRGRPGAGEERCDRQLPQGGEHPREPLRRDMAARPSALPVAGHERDRARCRVERSPPRPPRRARARGPAARAPSTRRRAGERVRRRRARSGLGRRPGAGRRIRRSAVRAMRPGSRTAHRRAARSGSGPRHSARRAPARVSRTGRSGKGARGRAGPPTDRTTTPVTTSHRARAGSGARGHAPR